MNTLHSVEKPGWIARILLTLTTITLVILGFFFLTVALAVGALVAAVIGVRLWWTIRKLKRAQSAAGPVTGRDGASVVDGEYRVIEHDVSKPQLPTAGQDLNQRSDADAPDKR